MMCRCLCQALCHCVQAVDHLLIYELIGPAMGKICFRTRCLTRLVSQMLAESFSAADAHLTGLLSIFEARGGIETFKENFIGKGPLHA